MSVRTSLIRVIITRDVNDRNEWAYLVTPFYALDTGRVVSVPDTRGWPTLAEAEAEANEIRSRN